MDVFAKCENEDGTARVAALPYSMMMAGVIYNKEIFEAFDKVSQEGTLLPYLDYATPTFSDTAGQGLQEVLGGQRTPEQVLEDFEADYAAFMGQ